MEFAGFPTSEKSLVTEEGNLISITLAPKGGDVTVPNLIHLCRPSREMSDKIQSHTVGFSHPDKSTNLKWRTKLYEIEFRIADSGLVPGS